jgi:hypothetical protein
MTSKDYVVKIHPSANCKRVVGDKRQWRVYYSWNRENGTRMHQLMGLGTSSQEAWKQAWGTIQLTMLKKFEGETEE